MKHPLKNILICLFLIVSISLLASCAGKPRKAVPLPAQKKVTFEKTFGGPDNDYGSSVIETSDGGYLFIGGVTPKDIDRISMFFGKRDKLNMYLVKTDKAGNTLWEKSYGGDIGSLGSSVIETADGGYLLFGGTYSEESMDDLYLVKIDKAGNQLWKKTYGGKNYDWSVSVTETADGSYLLFGSSASFGPTNSDQHVFKLYLVKTDTSGNSLWERTYGDDKDSAGGSMIETADGGYLLFGVTDTHDGDKNKKDLSLIKTNSGGNMIWEKRFGRGKYDFGDSVTETSDGSFLLLGSTLSVDSKGAGKAALYLIKTDSYGNSLWERTYGKGNGSLGFSVIEASDGSYMLFGRTFTDGAGTNDVYLIKTDTDGNKLWERTYGGDKDEEGHCMIETADGGFLLMGETSSYGSGGTDAYLIKTDENGNVYGERKLIKPAADTEDSFNGGVKEIKGGL